MTFDHARLCREKPPLRFERMPFIPRLKSLGFSGMVYKKRRMDEKRFSGLASRTYGEHL
jgi:hypothetical protein